MHSRHGRLPAIACLCAFLAGLALAGDNQDIDLFPAQSMSTLLAPVEKPAVEITHVMPPPAPAPPSFTVRGEWHEEGAAPHRVVVLEGFNQIFLLCTACGNDQAIHPGGQLPGGYLFKELTPQSVVLIGPDGQEQSLFI